jgi:hypothetical protein
MPKGTTLPPDQQPEKHPGSDPPPPRYDSVGLSEEEATEVERYWETNMPADYLNQPKPRRNLIFYCRPPVGGAHDQPEWRGYLNVNAKNIPQLMRKGFHCSESNRLPGRGVVLLFENKFAITRDRGLRWKHRRTYQFEDSGADPQWVATLVVLAKKPEIITKFRLEWAMTSEVFEAEAFDWNNRRVYHALRSKPHLSYNTLYDNMPSGGWWPGMEVFKV